MGQVSAALRQHQHGYSHWCPGCKQMHVIATAPSRPGAPVWSFDGNVDRPTFAPSILIRSGHFVPGWQGKECWCTESDPDFRCGICHYFIRDGRIEYCSDSTHKLAGRTVDLPPLPDHLRGSA
ncbi:MAG: DUF6527 family protein [Bacteroidota bacterium]